LLLRLHKLTGGRDCTDFTDIFSTVPQPSGRLCIDTHTQARPAIFDLKIEVPDVLYEEVVEVDEEVILPLGTEPDRCLSSFLLPCLLHYAFCFCDDSKCLHMLTMHPTRQLAWRSCGALHSTTKPWKLPGDNEDHSAAVPPNAEVQMFPEA